MKLLSQKCLTKKKGASCTMGSRWRGEATNVLETLSRSQCETWEPVDPALSIAGRCDDRPGPGFPAEGAVGTHESPPALVDPNSMDRLCLGFES